MELQHGLEDYGVDTFQGKCFRFIQMLQDVFACFKINGLLCERAQICWQKNNCPNPLVMFSDSDVVCVETIASNGQPVVL